MCFDDLNDYFILKSLWSKFLVKHAKGHIDNNLTSLIMKPCDGYVYIYI